MLISSLFIIASVVMLYFGAEISLETSEKVGKRMGMSPLVIGMVLIGFGTSLPEFFVGHIAGLRGSPDIAVGTLVGSNIANMFLILGVCGILTKLHISTRSLREHLWIHLLLSVVLIFVLSYGHINTLTGLILFVVITIYLLYIFKDMKREQIARSDREEVKEIVESESQLIATMKLLIGFILLYFGGELLVKGGSDLASIAGVSNYVISAIFIAFGTSFPELVTAIMASLKGKDTDLIIGNIVGSNVFNCAFILGSMGIYNFSIDQNFTYEIVSLNIGAIIFIFLAYTTRVFSKWSGSLFLFFYTIMVTHWLEIF